MLPDKLDIILNKNESNLTPTYSRKVVNDLQNTYFNKYLDKYTLNQRVFSFNDKLVNFLRIQHQFINVFNIKNIIQYKFIFNTIQCSITLIPIFIAGNYLNYKLIQNNYSNINNLICNKINDNIHLEKKEKNLVNSYENRFKILYSNQYNSILNKGFKIDIESSVFINTFNYYQLILINNISFQREIGDSEVFCDQNFILKNKQILNKDLFISWQSNFINTIKIPNKSKLDFQIDYNNYSKLLHPFSNDLFNTQKYSVVIPIINKNSNFKNFYSEKLNIIRDINHLTYLLSKTINMLNDKTNLKILLISNKTIFFSKLKIFNSLEKWNKYISQWLYINSNKQLYEYHIIPKNLVNNNFLLNVFNYKLIVRTNVNSINIISLLNKKSIALYKSNITSEFNQKIKKFFQEKISLKKEKLNNTFFSDIFHYNFSLLYLRMKTIFLYQKILSFNSFKNIKKNQIQYKRPKNINNSFILFLQNLNFNDLKSKNDHIRNINYIYDKFFILYSKKNINLIDIYKKKQIYSKKTSNIFYIYLNLFQINNKLQYDSYQKLKRISGLLGYNLGYNNVIFHLLNNKVYFYNLYNIHLSKLLCNKKFNSLHIISIDSFKNLTDPFFIKESLLTNLKIKIINKNNLIKIFKKENDYSLSTQAVINKFNFQRKNIIFLNQQKNKNLLQSFSLFKWRFFQNYKYWIFTLEWWNSLIKFFLNFFPEIYQEIKDCNSTYKYEIQLKINTSIVNFNKKILEKFIENLEFQFDNKLFKDFFDRNRKKIINDIKNLNKNTEILSFWESIEIITKINSLYYSLLSWVIIFYILGYRYKLYTLTGIGWLYLWFKLEIIRHLQEPSWEEEIDFLIYHKRSDPTSKKKWTTWNYYNYLLIGNQKIKFFLNNAKTLDINRIKKNPVMEFLITNKQLNKNYPQKKYYIWNQPWKLGNYLDELSKIYNKNLIHNDLIKSSLAEIILLGTLYRKISPFSQNFNIEALKLNINSLSQIQTTFPKGLLLIGNREIGKSYLVKKLALDSKVPLLHLSIIHLLYNRPDEIQKQNYDEFEPSIASRISLKKLGLFIDLAKKLAPCIVWIPDIHKLNDKKLDLISESTLIAKTEIILPTFLRKLDQIIINNSNDIIFIGSTNVPRKLDPAFISLRRFNHLLNIRPFTIRQREERLRLFFKNKQFVFKNNLYQEEMAQRTMGYNNRELDCLVNESCLVTISQELNHIDINSIRIALHHQSRSSINKENNPYLLKDYQSLFYKVGRAISQVLFFDRQPLHPLYLHYDWWKGRFYSLGKFYLDIPKSESVLKEFTLMSYLLGCLAGSAARDFYIISNKDFIEDYTKLNIEIEHELYIASELSKLLINNFSWLDTIGDRKTKKLKYSKINNEFINGNHNKINELKNCEIKMLWSPRIWNISFLSTKKLQIASELINFKQEIGAEKNKSENIKSNFCFNLKNIEITTFSLNVQQVTIPYKRYFNRPIYKIPTNTKEFFNIVNDQDYIDDINQKLENSDLEYQQDLYDFNKFDFQYSRYLRSRNLLLNHETIKKLYRVYGILRQESDLYPDFKLRKLIPISRFSNYTDITLMNINELNDTNIISQKIKKKSDNFFQGYTQKYYGKYIKPGTILTRSYWDLIEQTDQSHTIEVKNERINNSNYWKLFQLQLNYSTIYRMIFESYEYLLIFFIMNQEYLTSVIENLSEKNILFSEDIEKILYTKKNK
uniref:Cell division protein n=1 Tax=Coleochaete scutata TaxID=3125 RepID=A0A191T5I4_COLSC|nr:cell division protein [Coleochaete scutata]ANI25655.1 cell division protein [Coleochaete scutata]